MFNSSLSGKLSEEELVKLIKYDDNNEALSILLSIYKPFIINKIRSFPFNEFDFDDVYQECVIGLYNIIFDYIQDKSSFRTFASVCINRILISLFRGKSNKCRIPHDSIVDFDESNISCDFDTPEVILERYDNYENLLNKAREQLSPLELSVLMKLADGLSYAEISKTIGVSVKSVDNAVQRIRKKFSNLL